MPTNKFSFFLPIAISFLLLACATKPRPESPLVNKGRWESKVKIIDLDRGGAVHSLSVDILGEKRGPMRLEITALLGLPVASYVMDSNQFRCAVYRQKKFFVGPLDKAALRPVLKYPVSPDIIRSVTFDLPMEDKSWICKADDAGLVSECVSPVDQIKMQWKRDGRRKTVLVQGPGFKMDWFFEAPSEENQFRPGLFELEPPPGFKVIQL